MSPRMTSDDVDVLRELSNIGAGPVFDGIGLFMPVLSYAGTISIGVTSCREILPNVEEFCGFLEDSLAELEKAVLPPPARAARRSAVRRTTKNRKARRA